ncbi:GntR family transcriptional regulator [Paenibacillus piri]|uniref:GntR family transcriptional regulator n=1 Tax=Paenibacillus piri TaxID=2547395 RepID=A0A4R5KK00_9BACL|nr:GntR family transcriptional regulator [Paenibacillus piri]TDF95766.1 GntR family transcriptional regulator [Paenibacillus piri]
MNAAPSSLLPNSISAQVYESLKAAIMEGRLVPGSRLLVLDIANTFQISQAPVREALERLKQEGLILGKPNKGSVVSEITAKEIVDIVAVREMMEGFAVKHSLPYLEENHFQELGRIVQCMEDAIRHKNKLRLVELDHDFHGCFYELCGNHVVQQMWEQMKMKVMRFIAVSNYRFSTERLAQAHYHLIDVLRSGDPSLAEAQFVDHLQAYKTIHTLIAPD